jgi:hypothetical protein
MGRRLMRSSYLREWLHCTSTLFGGNRAQPRSERIKLSLALSYRQELLPCITLLAAAINPPKPDRAACRDRQS